MSVDLEASPGFAVLRLRNPKRANALTAKMMSQIHSHLDAILGNNSIRGVCSLSLFLSLFSLSSLSFLSLFSLFCLSFLSVFSLFSLSLFSLF
jgi:hypothetical protein